MSRIKQIVESKVFSNGIIVLIILNSVTLGIETFPLGHDSALALSYFNWFCTIIFIIEIVMKLMVYRGGFFREGWNIFDLIVITLSIIPEISFFSSARVLRILRVFKVFRATRLIGHVERLQNVIQAMLNALPSIGWTVGILAIVYYVYAVMGTNLYSAIAPDYFGNLWITFYTLFQLTMGDDIGEITRLILDQDPAAAVYFISFMVIAVLLILNLVIGVVVSSIDETRQQKKTEERLKTSDELEIEMERLDQQVALVKGLLEKQKRDNR